MNDEKREELGKIVREEWIAWAKEQPNPKPSWLVPWEGLSESDKEVDRRIGSALYRIGMEDDIGALVAGVQVRKAVQLMDELAAAKAEIERLKALCFDLQGNSSIDSLL